LGFGLMLFGGRSSCAMPERSQLSTFVEAVAQRTINAHNFSGSGNWKSDLSAVGGGLSG
jgi:hypothetical protein